MEGNKNTWDEQVIKAVWRKGRINPDFSPDVLRWDRNGHVMMWSEYGRKDSKFGWGIKAGDGVKNIENLQPLNLWYENR